MPAFDFAAFKRALETQHAAGWVSFYTADAELIEYRHASPPSAPNIMRGREMIGSFIQRVSSQPLKLTVEDEIVGDGRAAFRLTVELDNRRRIIEHIMIYFSDGESVRQIDVEAWDP